MPVTVLIAVAVVILAVALFIFRAVPGVRTYLGFRGKRLITCPETQKIEAVDVDAKEAAFGAFLAEPTLRLKQCSRWPERKDCGQDCLRQVEADPEKCLVWDIVGNWYEGKVCAFCHKHFKELRHLDHAPALRGPDGKTVEWSDLPPRQLPEVFAAYQPVCWNCHVTETFRRLHPELLVSREFGNTHS